MTYLLHTSIHLVVAANGFPSNLTFLTDSRRVKTEIPLTCHRLPCRMVYTTDLVSFSDLRSLARGILANTIRNLDDIIALYAFLLSPADRKISSSFEVITIVCRLSPRIPCLEKQ